MYILVINSGSSSIKFQLFKNSKKQARPYIKGIADAIGLANSSLELNGQPEISYSEKITLKTHQSALRKIFDLLIKEKIISNLNEIKLIGHRVVHGGEKYRQATIINAKVVAQIKALCPLAPLHNPHALHCIQACQKLLPKVTQVAVFDTAFHQTMPALAYLYALPLELYKKHQIRRFGFHGINHQYVSETASQLLKKAQLPSSRIISCHLGNGCSITAIKNGQSIETSMGFTPLEGLVMGTRCGDIDPALPLELSKILKKSPAEINQLLNKESGLLGLSGVSSDMRTVHQSAEKGNQKAQFAISLFAYRLAQYINSYIGVLGGIDAIIFTGGIGEHAWYIRPQVIQYLQHLGIKLNNSQNQKNQTFVSDKSSKTQILVIPANEELAIARQSLKIKL